MLRISGDLFGVCLSLHAEDGGRMALGHKEQAARHALGQVLQRGPLSTAGLGSAQQLRECSGLNKSCSDGLSSAVGCISGPLEHALYGRDQRLTQSTRAVPSCAVRSNRLGFTR